MYPVLRVDELNKIPEKKALEAVGLTVWLNKEQVFSDGLSFLVRYPNLRWLKLERYIRQGYGIYGLYPCRDADDQTSGLDSLDGIEYCPRLRSLYIVDIPVKSFSGIEYCTDIETISIKGFLKCSLGILAALPSLRHIKILDINFSERFIRSNIFRDLKSLESLALDGCRLSNLEIIRGSHLKYLSCEGCSLETLQGLKVDRLVYLNLSCNKLKTVKRLRHAKKLTHLCLCNNLIDDLKPIDAIYDSLECISLHSAYISSSKAMNRACRQECSNECSSQFCIEDIIEQYDAADGGSDSSDDEDSNSSDDEA